jgi:hypothetical protein
MIFTWSKSQGSQILDNNLDAMDHSVLAIGKVVLAAFSPNFIQAQYHFSLHQHCK